LPEVSFSDESFAFDVAGGVDLSIETRYKMFVKEGAVAFFFFEILRDDHSQDVR
jgi:hypothetical protein